MFERFSQDARNVVVQAQNEARRAGAHHIGPEHLLMGLMLGRSGIGYDVLHANGITLEFVRAESDRLLGRSATGFGGDDVEALKTIGIDLEAVVESVERSFGPGALAGGTSSSITGHIPFAHQAKKVLELSLREALRLHHNYIGTEHILLGMVRQGDGPVAQILTNGGTEPDALREQVEARVGPASDSEESTLLRSAGRLSPEGLATVKVAQALAQQMDTPTGTEHLLLALILGDGPASDTLAGSGFNHDRVRGWIATHKPKASGGLVGRLRRRGSPTSSIKKVLEDSLRECVGRGDSDVGNSHMLLGLLDGDSTTTAMKIIHDAGVSPVDLRARLIEAIDEAA
jgi:ATP-dependent Clp protease ATP-binding subunit ClpA